MKWGEDGPSCLERQSTPTRGGPDLQHPCPTSKVAETFIQAGSQHPALNFGLPVTSMINRYF